MSNDYRDELDRIGESLQEKIDDQHKFLVNYQEELETSKPRDTQQRYDAFLTTEMEKHNTSCLDEHCHLVKLVIEATETFGHKEMEQDE